MAANEGIRSSLSTQPVSNFPKGRVYEYLHLLNQSLMATLQILKRLEKCPGLRRDFLRSFQLEVRELRAEANFELTERLSECEQHDWGRFGRLRREWERQFEDPDDVYLKASREKKIAESWDCRHATASSRIPRSQAKRNAWKPNKDGRRSSPGKVGAEDGQSSGTSVPCFGLASLVGGLRIRAPGRELLTQELEAEVVHAHSSRRIRGRCQRTELDG